MGYWKAISMGSGYLLTNQTDQLHNLPLWEYLIYLLLQSYLHLFFYRKLWNSSILVFQNHKMHANWVLRNKIVYVTFISFDHSPRLHLTPTIHTLISNVKFLAVQFSTNSLKIWRNCVISNRGFQSRQQMNNVSI